jgi:hypothetical protein
MPDPRREDRWRLVFRSLHIGRSRSIFYVLPNCHVSHFDFLTPAFVERNSTHAATIAVATTVKTCNVVSMFPGPLVETRYYIALDLPVEYLCRFGPKPAVSNTCSPS